MKVLQVNKYLKVVGGAETYMFELSKGLSQRGIEVKFWGMEDTENIVSDFPGLEAKNINYSNQNFKSKLKSITETIYSRDNKTKMAKVLDTYKPDIVHIHNYNFQITPSILPEIKKRGIKVVQTIHDSQMVCPYHRLFNFQRNQICTKCVEGSFFNCIKDKCFDGSLLKSTLGALESFYYHSNGYYVKYIDTFISPSKFLAELIKKRIDKDIKVIPNYVKSHDNLEDNNQGDYFLYYGRISEEKGVLELIEIFKQTNLNLVIVGKGDLDNEVTKLVSATDNIKFLGPKYNKDLFSIVNNAKYVIQPSKWFENCPMTVVESFSLGVPVIASNHSGFKDLITNNETGFLIDFNNKEEAVFNLLKINETQIQPIKENVLKYYKKHLSETVHLSKVSSIYKDLLSSND